LMTSAVSAMNAAVWQLYISIPLTCPYWTSNLQRDDIHGYHRIDALWSAPGETLAVPLHRFTMASLAVGARPWAHLVLNGRTLDGQTPMAIEHIAAGSHRISAMRPGFRVVGAWQLTDAGREPLTRMSDEDGRPQFRLDLVADQDARIEFELTEEQ